MVSTCLVLLIRFMLFYVLGLECRISRSTILLGILSNEWVHEHDGQCMVFNSSIELISTAILARHAQIRNSQIPKELSQRDLSSSMVSSASTEKIPLHTIPTQHCFGSGTSFT